MSGRGNGVGFEKYRKRPLGIPTRRERPFGHDGFIFPGTEDIALASRRAAWLAGGKADEDWVMARAGGSENNRLRRSAVHRIGGARPECGPERVARRIPPIRMDRVRQLPRCADEPSRRWRRPKIGNGSFGSSSRGEASPVDPNALRATLAHGADAAA